MLLVASSGTIEAGSPVLWAVDRAERVLPYFEEKYPNDDRPRKALEAARARVRGEAVLRELRAAALAAHAVAYANDAERERDKVARSAGKV